ncbi:hypothetical protein AB0H34_03105 [Saccharopolyspora shandongensis]|uniref:hypothetical protein n=1 Tax=Saccharopolyspora shandongensis TaxID=418495 RepID=UPI0034087CE8
MTSGTDRDDLRRILLGELEYVELHVSGKTSLAGSDLTDPGVMDWSATASIYVLCEDDTPGSEPDRAWQAAEGIALSTTNRPGGEGLDLTILEANGITIDLAQVEDVFDALDARSQDDAHFIPLFGARDQFGFVELAEELEDTLEPGGTRVVILDRVRLAPAWRGLGGIGRLLTARLLRWVCDEPRIVAVHPFPIDLDGDQRRDDEVFVHARHQVRRTWASLGFEPFTDDLWIMDPHSSAHEKAVADISQRLGLD